MQLIRDRHSESHRWARNAKKAVAGLVLTTCALAASGAQVGAHEGPLGSDGPFTVVLDAQFPDGIEPRVGHGEIELHVSGDIEVTAYGFDGEEMVFLDAGGNMYANTNSASWWLNQDAGTGQVPAGTDTSAEPSWEWQLGGGSVQYHDHRIHYMAAGVDPGVKDGDTVQSFALEFLIDGQKVTIPGRVVFDTASDPDGAATLLAASGAGGGMNTVLVVAMVVVALGALGGVGFAVGAAKRRTRAS